MSLGIGRPFLSENEKKKSSFLSQHQMFGTHALSIVCPVADKLRKEMTAQNGHVLIGAIYGSPNRPLGTSMSRSTHCDWDEKNGEERGQLRDHVLVSTKG